MDEDNVRHEIIQFRREEIADLTSMPSAQDQPEMFVQRRPFHQRLARTCLFTIAGFALLIGALWIAVTTIGSSGFASDQLRARVEQLVHQATGPDLKSSIGPARLTLSGAELLALDLDQFDLVRPADGFNILQAEHLTFGLKIWPLLLGQVELASARISGARISVDQLGGQGPGLMAKLLDNRGLVDPDRLAPEAFATLDQFVAVMRRSSSDEIKLQDIVLQTAGGQNPDLTIRDATMARGVDAFTLEGVAEVAGVAYTFDGSISAAADGRTNTFNLKIADASTDDAAPAAMSLEFSGDRGVAGSPERLLTALSLRQKTLDFGKNGVVSGDVDIQARVTQGEGKIEIERADINVGRSRYLFTGAIAPMPDDEAAPAYKFELVSNDSVIAPEDSTEPAMLTSIRLAGSYDPKSSTLDVNDIRARASTGEAAGRAALVFTEGLSPAVSLNIKVAGMSVAQVKQLWPWVAAGSARRWMMQKFFGGTVREGEVRYEVAAGKIDDGKPETEDEVSGRFVIEGSRFDTAGVMPPVRDAVGAVQFRGSRIDVSLEQGKAYMDSGRMVNLSEGTLLIEDVRANPLIGRLSMKMAGNADAMAEIASFEPIDALRRIDLKPEDFSGTVEGRVDADIPLQRGVDRETLDWGVSLAYKNLALAKPFDGQLISDADGTISLEPEKAVVSAKAKLNDIPAELDLVLPLGDADLQARRDITLVLDDKTRAAMAPGLDALISGTLRVKVDATPGQDRRMEADLTQTKLSIPWAGWAKGAGVAAKASFVLAGTPGNREIRDFKLTGKSFGASGSISLANGSFQSASFNNVAFNAQDDLAISVKRQGRAFAVNVTGSSLDGRALIKRMTEGKATSEKGDAPVTLSAAVGSVAGFGNETLKDVKITYRGGSTSIAARTAGGAPVSMDDAGNGGQRRISATTGDAGSMLRFLNVYGRLEGGTLKLTLAGENALRGKIDIRDFQIVNEPKLASVVSTPAGDGRSLNQAVKTNIDTSRVQFARGFAELDKSATSLKVKNAVLRGPVIGTTFEGTVYDGDNRMDLSGTFMPAYGLNSIFGDIPVLGAFLGNGENGGLIGVTYRLRGDAKSPNLDVNPLSVMAPGIFRQIFEY